jgi:hypothetical protein
LEGAFKKLNWGAKHLRVLVDEIAAALESKENNAVVQRETDTRYAIQINFGPWPLDEWSLRLGDAIHSIRGALDHAAWEIVCRGGRLPEDERERRRIAFPIFDSPKGFRGAPVLRYVDAGTRTIFEEAQPYATGKALQFLAALSNDDKHRLLLPNVLAYAEGDFEIRIKSNEDVGEVGDPVLTVGANATIESGAKIGHFDAVIVGDDPKMYVQCEFPGLIAFRAREGEVVITGMTLVKLASFVQIVLQRLQLNLQGFVPR